MPAFILHYCKRPESCLLYCRSRNVDIVLSADKTPLQSANSLSQASCILHEYRQGHISAHMGDVSIPTLLIIKSITLRWSSCTRAQTYLNCRMEVCSGDSYMSTDSSISGFGIESAVTLLGGSTGACRVSIQWH